MSQDFSPRGWLTPYDQLPSGNRPATILGLTFSSMVLCIICVAARLYTRFCVLRQPGWDDLCMTFAFFTTTAGSWVAYYLVKHGLGQHTLDVPPNDLTAFSLGTYLQYGFYSICAGATKMAILLQYLRFFDPAGMSTRITKFVFFIVLLWTIIFSIMAWFPCTPIHKVWNSEIKGHCYGFGTARTDLQQYFQTLLIQGVTNMVLDIATLALPMPYMWTLGTKTGFRIRLGILYLLGLLVTISAAARVGINAYIMEKNDRLRQGSHDIMYQMPWAIIMLSTELNLSAVCASVPVFWGPMTQAIQGKWDQIFVTKEVSVVRTSRANAYGGGGGGGGGGGPGGDERGGGGGGETGRRTRDTNDEEERYLTRRLSGRSLSLGSDGDIESSGISLVEQQKCTAHHYKDSFVQSYVNPLQAGDLSETTIQSMARKGSKKEQKM